MSTHQPSFAEQIFILGLGAQKSGTTWLYEYLDSRSDVYMHPIKEVHYFDGLYESEKWPNVVKNRRQKEADLRGMLAGSQGQNDIEQLEKLRHIEERNRYYEHPDMYMQHFASNAGGCRAFGEITAEYSTLSADTYEKMYGMHPDVRFVLLVRDPVDRLWSQIKMLSKFERRGFEPGKSQEQRVDRALGKEKVIARSRYDTTLKNLLDRVPESSLYVGFFEELFSDRSLRRLCEFLSLPFVPGNYGQVVNESRGQRLEPRQARRIFEQLAPTYEYFHARYGDRLPARWREHLE